MFYLRFALRLKYYGYYIEPHGVIAGWVFCNIIGGNFFHATFFIGVDGRVWFHDFVGVSGFYFHEDYRAGLWVKGYDIGLSDRTPVIFRQNTKARPAKESTCDFFAARA